MRQWTGSYLTPVMAMLLALLPSASAWRRRVPHRHVRSAEGSDIFGRWQTLRTCTGLVRALEQAHLRRLAPGVVGDYFPDKTPQQLATKEHICWGAEPQRHSHLFTGDGHFGSVEQNNQQVDNGRYRVINSRMVRINGLSFRYQVVHLLDDKYLALKPMITKRMRRQALAHPLQFSAAGYAVAVAYTGHTWKRVRCGPWC